ncbi:MAG: hypothetical protein R2720_00255 [Candidatus Nanopelagicales bacterium]
MADLDGSGIPVDLGAGVTLVAPGLLGTAERAPELLGGRADEEPPATPALTDALTGAGLQQVHGVQIDATEVPPVGADVRGPHDEGLMLLQVPDLGPDSPQVLLQVDEAGIATWHFPEPVTGMAPGTLEFSVPREVATDSVEGASDDRGLAAAIGRKLLSVLVFPAIEKGVGLLARVLAEKYEKTSRPYRLRTFAPGETRTPGAGDLTDRGWDGIDGRALLFVHGTFATSHGTFSGLPDEVIGHLWNAYGGNVLAFDHPSLSVTPQQNAAQLLSMIPPDRRLDVDIVSHSRGGLVARAIADIATGSPLQVRSTVFVAAPNGGTPLADDAHIKSFIDRMTTMLNLIPDGPLSLPADILGGVLDVVKILAAGAVEGLPGLRAMDPTDPGLGTLGSAASPDIVRYAVDVDFEPTGSLLSLTRVKDAAVDLVFGQKANDMVVPTDGAAGAAGLPGFPVPADRRLSFGRSSSVWHCSFFSQPQTAQHLRQWFRPEQG